MKKIIFIVATLLAAFAPGISARPGNFFTGDDGEKVYDINFFGPVQLIKPGGIPLRKYDFTIYRENGVIKTFTFKRNGQRARSYKVELLSDSLNIITYRGSYRYNRLDTLYFYKDFCFHKIAFVDDHMNEEVIVSMDFSAEQIGTDTHFIYDERGGGNHYLKPGTPLPEAFNYMKQKLVEMRDDPSKRTEYLRANRFPDHDGYMTSFFRRFKTY